MSDWQILVAVVPADLKDDVVDTLITLEGISGFSLSSIAGYSVEHSHFNLREQVEGYRSFFRFEILHQAQQQTSLMAALGPVCTVANVRYWVMPVIAQGHFGDL